MRALMRAASSAARSEGERRMIGDVDRARLDGGEPADSGLRRANSGEPSDPADGDGDGERTGENRFNGLRGF